MGKAGRELQEALAAAPQPLWHQHPQSSVASGKRMDGSLVDHIPTTAVLQRREAQGKKENEPGSAQLLLSLVWVCCLQRSPEREQGGS